MTSTEDHIARTRREASQTPVPVTPHEPPVIDAIPDAPRNKGRFTKKTPVIAPELDADHGITL